MDARLRITPEFFSIIVGMMFRRHKNIPLTFTSMTLSKSSTDVVVAVPTLAMPALLIKISGVPSFLKLLTVHFGYFVHRDITLEAMGFLTFGQDLLSGFFAGNLIRFQMATLAPSSANRLAIAWPIPFPPPVTMAVLFLNLLINDPYRDIPRFQGKKSSLP